MKLSKTFPRLIALGLVFVLMFAAVRTNNSSKANAGRVLRLDQQPRMSEEAPRKVTVILHGLMVGRYWNGTDVDTRFEVGIVKGEKQHRFSISYYYPGAQDCSNIPVNETRKLIFEVRRDDGQPVVRDIEMWHWQAGTRTYAENEFRDSSLILNMEGDRIHNEVSRHKNMMVLPKTIFDPIFHFHHGSVKTHTPTRLLLAKRPTVPCNRIGRIAEVVMVEINVKRGQQLVLAAKKHPEVVLWSRGWGEIITGSEVRILNLGHQDHADCNKSYDGCPKHSSVDKVELQDFLAEAQTMPPANCREEFPRTDFQAYYELVFNKNKRNRFELYCPEPCRCQEVKMHSIPVTVPPYRCGMVLVNNTEIK